MSGSLKQDSQKAHAKAFSWDSEDLSLALPMSQSRHWAFTVLGSFQSHQGTRLWRWKMGNWDIKYYRGLASSFTKKSMAQMAIPYKSVTTPVKLVQLLELKGNLIHLIGSIDFNISPQKSPFQMERRFARKTDKVLKIDIFQLKLLMWVVSTGMEEWWY